MDCVTSHNNSDNLLNSLLPVIFRFSCYEGIQTKDLPYLHEWKKERIVA